MRQTFCVLLLLASCAFSVGALATAQKPDTILLDGEELALNTNPLDAHLEAVKWSPPKDALISSGNWRGYTATWEIADDKLVLRDVTVLVKDEDGDYTRRSILQDLFPEVDPVVAAWYSGALIVAEGDLVHYVHMGYGSLYSRYRVARVARGEVTELISMSAEEFSAYRDAKYREFMATDEYRKALAEMKKGESRMTPEQIQDFIRSFYAETYLAL